MQLIILFLGVLSLAYEGDCAITAWTAPVISTKDGTATVTYLESQVTAIVTLAATAGADAFAITSQPVDGKLTLAAGGELTLTAGFAFDFETEPTYVIVVTGGDSGGSTGTATITISITDVAADANYDQSTTQYYRVADATAASTTIATITASGGTGTVYSIQSGNTNTDFAYGASTGVLTTAKAMVRSTTPGYVLNLQAVAASVTSFFRVVVCVGTTAQCGGSSGAAGLQISLAMLLVAIVISRVK